MLSSTYLADVDGVRGSIVDFVDGPIYCVRFLIADKEGVSAWVSASNAGMEGVLGPEATCADLILLLWEPLDNVTFGEGKSGGEGTV